MVNLLSQRKGMVGPKRNPKGGPKRPKLSTALPRASPAREETPRPTTGGKSPRIFSIKGSKPKKESSDVDTNSSEPDSE